MRPSQLFLLLSTSALAAPLVTRAPWLNERPDPDTNSPHPHLARKLGKPPHAKMIHRQLPGPHQGLPKTDGPAPSGVLPDVGGTGKAELLPEAERKGQEGTMAQAKRAPGVVTEEVGVHRVVNGVGKRDGDIPAGPGFIGVED